MNADAQVNQTPQAITGPGVKPPLHVRLFQWSVLFAGWSGVVVLWQSPRAWGAWDVYTCYIGLWLAVLPALTVQFCNKSRALSQPYSRCDLHTRLLYGLSLAAVLALGSIGSIGEGNETTGWAWDERTSNSLRWLVMTPIACFALAVFSGGIRFRSLWLLHGVLCVASIFLIAATATVSQSYRYYFFWFVIHWLFPFAGLWMLYAASRVWRKSRLVDHDPPNRPSAAQSRFTTPIKLYFSQASEMVMPINGGALFLIRLAMLGVVLFGLTGCLLTLPLLLKSDHFYLPLDRRFIIWEVSACVVEFSPIIGLILLLAYLIKSHTQPAGRLACLTLAVANIAPMWTFVVFTFDGPNPMNRVACVLLLTSLTVLTCGLATLHRVRSVDLIGIASAVSLLLWFHSLLYTELGYNTSYHNHKLSGLAGTMVCFPLPIIYALTWALLRPGYVKIASHMNKHPTPTCQSCGYNLTGTLAAGRTVCPECGAEIKTMPSQ